MTQQERDYDLIRESLDDFVTSLGVANMTPEQELGYGEVLQYVRNALGLPPL